MKSRMAWNSVEGAGLAQTCGKPPAYASQVFDLYTCLAVPVFKALI